MKVTQGISKVGRGELKYILISKMAGDRLGDNGAPMGNDHLKIKYQT